MSESKENNEGKQNKREKSKSIGSGLDENDKEELNKTLDISNAKLLCPSALSCLLSVMCPMVWTSCCLVVNESEENVVLNFGKYIGTIKVPGVYFVNRCGTQFWPSSTKFQSVDLGDVQVVDKAGSPLLISGVATYQIVDSRKAVLSVENPGKFLYTQALSVMKIVVSQYTYDELRENSKSLKKNLIDALQERVNKAGAKVTKFELSDMAYSKEIAQSMLVRQQAHAMVDARKTIVENACVMSRNVVNTLEESGVHFDTESKVKLLSNLIISLTGESGTTKTMNVGV